MQLSYLAGYNHTKFVQQVLSKVSLCPPPTLQSFFFTSELVVQQVIQQEIVVHLQQSQLCTPQYEKNPTMMRSLCSMVDFNYSTP